MGQDINCVANIYPIAARGGGHRRIAAHMHARTWLALTSLSLLAGCAREAPPAPSRADWVLETRVVFFEADGKTVRPTPKQDLRLWMPWVVGDIYGDPNEGELAPATLKPDLSFSLDLNKSREKVGRALVPTEFSQKWMSIEPREARVARISPFVLPADGIEPLGMCEWLDVDSRDKLMLVYFDRPARIRGEIVYEGRSLRFDIESKEAGYVWIRQPEGSGEFRMAPWPGRVLLAVIPK
jgi:hypothetical protein